MHNFRPDFPPPFFPPPPPGMNFNLQQPPSEFVTRHNMEHFPRQSYMNWTNVFRSGVPSFDERHPTISMSQRGQFPVTDYYYNATFKQRPPQPMSFGGKQDNWGNERKVVQKNMTLSISAESESQEDLDNKWLKTFVGSCEKSTQNKDLEQPKAKRMKISEAKELHARAGCLIKAIESNLQSSKISPDNQKMKEELDEILTTLTDESTMASLAYEVKKRKKKRSRAKEKRVADFHVKQHHKNQLNQKHQELDQWLIKRDKMQQIAKRDKQLQVELDTYLHEVRLKRDKLKKSLSLIQALPKLRKARKESALRKGQPLSETHDKVFMSAHSTAKENLLNSSSVCDEEEKSLKSFLAKERKMEEDNIKNQKLKEEEEKRDEWNRHRWKVLFGEQREVDAFDVMWPIQELHKHGTSTLSALANTRRQWDNYIVETNEGSSIQTRWLEPVEPSEGWAEFLERSDEKSGISV